MKTGKTLTKISIVFFVVIVAMLLARLGPFQPTGALLVSANVGTAQYVDVDGDGTNDLKVLVSKVLSSTAVELTITKLRGAKETLAAAAPAPEVEAPTGEVPVEVPTEAPAEVTAPTVPEKKPLASQTLTILIIAVVIAASIGLLYITRMQKSGEKKKSI